MKTIKQKTKNKKTIKRKILFIFSAALLLSAIFAGSVLSISGEWDYAMGGEIREVYSDDLDGDGNFEVIAHAFITTGVESYSTVYVFNKTGGVFGKINTRSEILDMQVIDFDRDGEKELIVAMGSLENNDIFKPVGSIVIYGKTGDIKQHYAGIQGFVHGIYASDVNNDSRNELLAASGYELVTTAHMQCYCKVYLLNRRMEETWAFKAHDDRVLIEEYMDVYAEDLDKVLDADNKTHKEIITSTSAGRIYLLDASGALKWNYSLSGIAKVYAADIDNPKELREATAYVCEASKVSESEKLDKGKPVCYACGMDSCDDKCNVSCAEIIASSPDGTVYVFGRNQTLRWSYKTDGRISGTSVTDINDDGSKEIVAGSDDVYVLNNNGKLIWRYKTPTKVLSIHAEDLNNDRIFEIIAGTENGLYLFGADGTLYEKYELEHVVSVHAADLNNDGVKEIVAGAGFNAYVFKVNEEKLYSYSAKTHYGLAQNYYKSEDYSNALVYANKSYAYYVLADDAAGSVKSKELIAEIEKTVYIKSKEKEADEYLKIAQFYYNLSNKTDVKNITAPPGLIAQITNIIIGGGKNEIKLVSCPINGSLVNVSADVCSKEYAKLARVIYLELGYDDKVNLTELMIPESERAGWVNVTKNETVPEEIPVNEEEKTMLQKIIGGELKIFGIPALYIIIIVSLILISFIYSKVNAIMASRAAKGVKGGVKAESKGVKK